MSADQSYDVLIRGMSGEVNTVIPIVSNFLLCVATDGPIDVDDFDTSNVDESGRFDLDAQCPTGGQSGKDDVVRKHVEIIVRTRDAVKPAVAKSGQLKTLPEGSPTRRILYLRIGLAVVGGAALATCGVFLRRQSVKRNKTIGPTLAPTRSTPTTPVPTTMSPTSFPTVIPTLTPTSTPTGTPTISPTSFPTVEDIYVPVNPVPRNRARSYFNYDMSDRQYGPNNWKRINMDGTYFREFGDDGFGTWDGHLTDHVADSTKNRCGVSGKQSPIDLYQTTGEESECTATHQIRTRRSVYRLESDEIKKLIEPNKLRLLFPRRKCKNLDNDDCNSLRPPSADFPKWSSTMTHYSDLLNLDIKIPGEHTIEGETFDAEIQMLHLHMEAPRMGYIGVPIRAKDDGFNREYQALLDQFQIAYDEHAAECAGNRRLRSPSFDHGAPYLNVTQDPSPAFGGAERELQSSGPFDPYRDFLKTVFFYRYHGSNTEPPCFPITWFVMTTPVVIDFHQLRQTKKLIFTHVDGKCRKTSIHNKDQSVVRPLQPLGIVPPQNKKREVMLCKVGDFKPDPQ